MGRGRLELVVKRFDVYLINLDPTIGSEIKKTRPCVIISPDEMNRHLNTAIIAPMTTTQRSYPTRIPVRFQGKDGEVVLDQIRAVDKKRLIKRLGSFKKLTSTKILDTLAEMFAE
jgi:mRNA interferase MazF